MKTKWDLMTVKEAVKYCYSHKGEYIAGFNDFDEGVDAFCCLLTLLEKGTISPSQLPKYGMDY